MMKSDLKGKRYELNIDSKYYNELDIEGFSYMMKDPSYCYKFYWLEAIVQLIAENKKSATYDEIINEMIANAWYSVVEFHIHLSGIWKNGLVKDNLEKAVLKLHGLSQLSNSASKLEIKNEIRRFDKELHTEKMYLTQNVPYKALSGFANRGPERININSSAGRMMAYYNRLSSIQGPLPYIFGDENGLRRMIFFQDSWIKLIQDNTVSILGWIQYEKVRWLQNNNPEIPGLVYKLAPLDEKLRKLSYVRKLWDGILDMTSIPDVFGDKLIDKRQYAVDHFIPWSFVMNDELWNLIPIDVSLNSCKSNKLPKWDKFFRKFAENQYIMYQFVQDKSGIRRLYEHCYRDNLHSIWASQELYRKGNSKEKFCCILESNMRPVYESARRQGYEIWDK